MADISKITLPSNVTYDVKDTTARSGLANKQDKITAITAQTTQAVYPIKIDSQGHITAYGSAVTIPAAVTESTVSGWGFTKNAGTITGIKMNGASKGTSGVVDLGTVITSHQDISGKVNKSGDTMTGQLKTSFKQSVAMGSFGSSSSTIPDLCEELRYSSGCCGSVSIGTAYTKDGITIATGWYNFLWVPHRSGGVNGAATGDNCDYGSLYLSGMTVSGFYMIRYSSKAISELRNIYKDTTYGANRGISNVSGNFGHSNTAITAQTTQAVYPIKIDAYGHITGYGSAVTIPAAVAVKGNSESTYRTGNVNLTAANIGAAASSHAHGDITSGGDITATATIASGDRLVINDESASKITNSSITFGTSTTTFLRNNGTWGTVDSGTSVYDGYGYAPSKYESLYLDTIASGTGTGVDMKPTIDLLWTNSAPTAAFAAQTISMNLASYRWFIVETKYTPSVDTRQYSVAFKGEETVVTNNQARNQTRHFTFTDSGVTVGAGLSHTTYNSTNGDSTQNTYILPIKIFGVK